MEDIIPSIEELRRPGPAEGRRNILLRTMYSIQAVSSQKECATIPVRSQFEYLNPADVRWLIQVLMSKGYKVDRIWCPDEDARGPSGFVYAPATEEQTESLLVSWGFICPRNEPEPIAIFYSESI